MSAKIGVYVKKNVHEYTHIIVYFRYFWHFFFILKSKLLARVKQNRIWDINFQSLIGALYKIYFSEARGFERARVMATLSRVRHVLDLYQRWIKMNLSILAWSNLIEPDF